MTTFVAEVEVSVDREGRISRPGMEEELRRRALGRVRARGPRRDESLDRPPPASFPPRVLVRFDVQEETEPVIQ